MALRLLLLLIFGQAVVHGFVWTFLHTVPTGKNKLAQNICSNRKIEQINEGRLACGSMEKNKSHRYNTPAGKRKKPTYEDQFW